MAREPRYDENSERPHRYRRLGLEYYSKPDKENKRALHPAVNLILLLTLIVFLFICMVPLLILIRNLFR